MATRDHTSPTLTVTGRLLRTRGVWVYFALVLASLVLAVQSLVQASRTANAHEVPLAISGRYLVEQRSAPWGVEPGDRVVAIDGTRFNNMQEFNHLAKNRSPGPVTLTFERDGRQWEQSGLAEPPPPSRRALSYIRVAVGISALLMGLFAFMVRPGGVIGWTFLLYCLDFGVLLLSRAAFREHYWLRAQVQATSVATAATVALHLFCNFPRKSRAFSWRPFFPAAYVLSSAVFVTRALAGNNPFGYALHTWLINGWAAFCAVAGSTVLVVEYRHAKRQGDAVRLQQYRSLGIAAVFGLALPIVANGVRMVFQVGGDWADLNTLPNAIFPLATGVALIRHNALGLDRFTAAVVGYAATVLLLGSGFFAVLFTLPLVLGGEAIRRPEVMVGLTAACFFAAQPLYRTLRRAIDRRFLRGEGEESSRISEALATATRAVQEQERDAALKTIVGAAMALRPDRAELWLLEADGARFSRAVSDTESPAAAEAVPRHGALGQAMARQLSGGVDQLAPKALEAAAQAELWRLSLAMVTPVLANGVVAGFLGIGRAISGISFRSESLSFLNVLGTQAGLALERSGSAHLRVGRYRIEKRLGVGGMAEVFLAWQLGPGGFERKVALKRPLPALADDPSCIARFVDEARISAGLHHRNIAQVFEIDQADGAYFLAMEFVDGPALRSLLKSASRQGLEIPLPITLAVGSALLKALAHAHGRLDAEGLPMGVVHRDVTPSNLLFTSGGEVKLLDFGIARAASQLHTTRTGAVTGTVPYMAPEQLRGERVSPLADLFSAGAVLYELLTLQKAFPDGYQGRGPPPPSRLSPSVSGALDRFIERALAEDPSFRFGSADEMRQALLDAAGGVRPAEEEAVARWTNEVMAHESRPDVLARVDAPTSPLPAVKTAGRAPPAT